MAAKVLTSSDARDVKLLKDEAGGLMMETDQYDLSLQGRLCHGLCGVACALQPGCPGQPVAGWQARHG